MLVLRSNQSNPFTYPSLFNRFFSDDQTEMVHNCGNGSLPAVNISEEEQAYKLEVAAPGLSKDLFKIDLDKNVLTISADSEVEEKDNYYKREFNYNSFKRSFVLPKTVKHDKIKAEYKDGVLSVNIPKKEEVIVKPRHIEVA